MSLVSYSDLVTSVGNWLHRDNLGSIVPDLIVLGEKHIYRVVRHRHMEASFTSVISGGVITLPDDYVELKNAYVDAASAVFLHRKNLEWIYSNYPVRSSDGCPNFIAREATSFIFGPFPDSDYTIKGTYYKRLQPLASVVNNLFLDHPGLWLWSALMASAPFLADDDRVATWETMLANEISSVNSEQRREDFSGSSIGAA